jgi:hypothetical protein
MWAYSDRFQTAIDLAARDTFTALDQALDARAFLVGFRGGPGEAPAVRVEPDDIGCPPALFERVPELVAGASGEQAAESPEARRVGRAWQRAIEEALAGEDAASGWRSFASAPAEVGAWRVACVLQLTRQVADAYPCLTRSTDASGERIATSLLDALVDAFLVSCATGLGAPEPGRSSHALSRTANELHRSAGRGLMQTVARACRCPEALYTLYDATSELSAARYEGGATRARVILAPQAHPDVECLVQFHAPVMLANTKAARKLLEVATPELAIVTDGARIYGLGRSPTGYEPGREDLFVVDFLDQHAWQLSHGGQPLMRVQYGRPALPRQPIDPAKLASIISRIFKELGRPAVATLCTLMEAATRQQRGTLLVVSDHAADEAKRLAVQSTLIRPIALTPTLVDALTAIDGALLLDPQGCCHAIGVILDGLATTKGTSARGARFNSAIRYVDTATRQFGHRCLAVVVSEDGPTDIVPELMPQIPRRLILDQIEAFEALKGHSPVRAQDLNRFLRWFQAHSFYIWGEAAQEINRIRRELELALEVSSVSIVWRRVEPNPDLDDSYFTD